MTRLARRLAYLRRILSVYARPGTGPLSFWYEQPRMHPALGDSSPAFYMTFRGKSEYRGPFDERGVPLLDYRGDIGRQYNPIAIAQYGLATFNRFLESGEPTWHARALAAADWLVDNLEPNDAGVPAWHHHFDWPYRSSRLQAPWYSGLAQGQGVSLLLRVAEDTGAERYAVAADAAWEAMVRPVGEGGVLHIQGPDVWIEEYLVNPPSHILNGFIWASWGVLDYARWRDDAGARRLFDRCCATLGRNLDRYDTGNWSLYELPNGVPTMLASPYYHALHVTQLRVLHSLTGNPVFSVTADRWDSYQRDPVCRYRALLQKAWFKLRHY